MERIAELVTAWDEGFWEFTLAFEGLADEDLWRRADPKLLSVGEIAGHVTYWEAGMAAANTFHSPLADERFNYYTGNIGAPVVLDLSVAEVLEEVKKVHDAAKSELASIKSLDDPVPSRPDFKWGAYLRYRVFHVSYHTGQAYSVRHLMGHTTTDN